MDIGDGGTSVVGGGMFGRERPTDPRNVPPVVGWSYVPPEYVPRPTEMTLVRSNITWLYDTLLGSKRVTLKWKENNKPNWSLC